MSVFKKKNAFNIHTQYSKNNSIIGIIKTNFKNQSYKHKTTNN